MKNIIVVIPSRYASKRLPGKPLRLIKNKPLIYWTWKNIVKIINKNQVYVATDSEKIVVECKKVGIQTLKTSSKCKTGTDRVAETAHLFKKKILVSIQGDEPFLKKKYIKQFLNFAEKNKNFVTNAYTEIKIESQYKSLNIPKVVLSKNNFLMYMSRSPIPGSKKNIFNKSFKQVCMYGFPQIILKKFFGISKNKSKIEKIEDIEILRFIENNVPVKMIRLGDNILSVDTIQDLKKANQLMF